MGRGWSFLRQGENRKAFSEEVVFEFKLDDLRKQAIGGTSLEVQCLRFQAPNEGCQGLNPGPGTRPQAHN